MTDADGQLRFVDGVPVPQLDLQPRWRPDRHPRPSAHVSRRHSHARTTGWCRSASRSRGTSSCSGACRTRRRRSASGSHPSPIATTATGSTRSSAIRASWIEVYPINWKAFVENSNDDYHVRFVHRRINSQRKSLDTQVRFDGRTCSGYKPHPDSYDTTGGRTDMTEEDLAGPLRRLHLPQPHAAAVRHHADPGARRSAGARPNPVGVAHVRPGQDARRARGRHAAASS